MSEKIQSVCPACKASIAAPATLIGKTATCPKCSARFKIVAKFETLAAAEAPPLEIRDPDSPALQAASENAAPPKSRWIGVDALILGILAVLTAWIPLVGVVGVVLAVVALVIAGVGIMQTMALPSRGIGFSIAGATLAAVAIAIFAVVHLAIGRAVHEVEDVAKKLKEAKEHLRPVGPPQPPFGTPPNLPHPPGPPPIFERASEKPELPRSSKAPPIFEPVPAKSAR